MEAKTTRSSRRLLRNREKDVIKWKHSLQKVWVVAVTMMRIWPPNSTNWYLLTHAKRKHETLKRCRRKMP